MNGKMFRYDVHSELPPVPEGPTLLGMKFVETLDALSRIGPFIAGSRTVDLT